MLRSAAGKVAWLGRTASMVFGLALVLGLVFGVATMALGDNGGNFILGKATNTATRITGLVSEVANPDQAALQVRNSGEGPALDLRVGEPGSGPAAKTVAPMKVNSQVAVTNLNADQLDGNDASDFLGSAAVVRTNNTNLANGDDGVTDLTAPCEAGEIATGGGGALVLDGSATGLPAQDDFVVFASRPTQNADGVPIGWQASLLDRDADSSANGAFTVRVYAVCTNVGADAPATP